MQRGLAVMVGGVFRVVGKAAHRRNQVASQLREAVFRVVVGEAAVVRLSVVVVVHRCHNGRKIVVLVHDVALVAVHYDTRPLASSSRGRVDSVGRLDLTQDDAQN